MCAQKRKLFGYFKLAKSNIKPFRFQNVDILHFKGIGDLALEAEVMDISSKTSRPDHFFPDISSCLRAQNADNLKTGAKIHPVAQ